MQKIKKKIHLNIVTNGNINDFKTKDLTLSFKERLSLHNIDEQ